MAASGSATCKPGAALSRSASVDALRASALTKSRVCSRTASDNAGSRESATGTAAWQSVEAPSTNVERRSMPERIWDNAPTCAGNQKRRDAVSFFARGVAATLPTVSPRRFGEFQRSRRPTGGRGTARGPTESWSVIHPTRQPGTAKVFASPPTAKTGHFPIATDAVDTNALPPKTKSL